MSTALVNLDEFKGGPAAEFAAINPADHPDISDVVGVSYGVIGYKGKEWSLRYRGQTHYFSKYGIRVLKAVILRQPGVKSKSYYPRYDEDSKAPPVCSSLNGVTPDVGVQDQQSETCALCPRNQWKKLPNGRDGRECADRLRIAVALHPEMTMPIFGGEALLDPVFLPIPAASLKNLEAMASQMRSLGFHYYQYLTEIEFDPAESYPKMVFRATKKLLGAEAKFVVDLIDHPDVKRITGEAGGHGMKQVAARPVEAPAIGFNTAKAVKVEEEKVVPIVPRHVEETPWVKTIEHQPAKIESGFASTASNGSTAKSPSTTTVSAPAEPANEELPPADANLDSLIGDMIGALKGNG